MSGIGKIVYIKISRTDGNGTDITTSLEALETIVLPLSTGNKELIILNRTKESQYFLFYVSMAGTEDIPGVDKSSPTYIFSGSANGFLGNFRLQPPITSSADNLGFFLPRGTSNSLGSLVYPEQFGIDSYRITTLPAKNIGVHISSSFNFLIEDSRDETTSVTASIRILTNPLTVGTVPSSPNVLAESVITQSAQDLDVTDMVYTGSFEIFTTISASQYTPGDCLYFDLNLEAYGPDPTDPPIAAFTNGDFQNLIWEISSSAAVANPLDLSVEPYFTSPFYGTDCDVMYGDISQGVENNFLQDVDYSTDMLIPVNYLAIQNNTATRATVPESYYTSLAQTNIRYNGSINQSEKINQWTENFNIGNYGKTSPINLNQTTIYEYEWAGGTTPEILGWGAYKTGKILNFQTPSDVSTINPSSDISLQLTPTRWPFTTGKGNFNRNENITQSVGDYYYALNGNNKINERISIFPYETNIGEVSPSTTKILTTDYGVPPVSNFILTSSNARYGNITSGSNAIYLTSSVDISRCKKVNGAYATGKVLSPLVFDSSPSESLSPQLNEGERWFITLYNQLDVPINNDLLIPYNLGVSGSSDGNLNNPLGYKGVFEIYGARRDATPSGTIVSLIIGPTNFIEDRIIGGGVNGLGALIWKAREVGKNNFVMVQSEVGSNGPGCFVNQYVNKEIIENLDSITKTFGSNTS